MVIYIDIYFLVNFIMDFITLYVCDKVLLLNCKKVRLLLSAILGGVYSVFSVFIILPEPISAIIVSGIMCYIAFGNVSKLIFIKAIIMFYAAGLLLGGILTFLYGIIYKHRNSKIFSNGIGIVFFIIVFIALLFIILSGKILKTYIYKKSVSVEIQIDKQSIKLTLLCDSGNMLYDPFSGKSVIVLGVDVLDEVFGEKGFYKGEFENITSETLIQYKIRLLPVKCVGTSTTMMSFSPDRISLINNNGKKIDISAVLAVDRNGRKGSYSGCDGIISQSICKI